MPINLATEKLLTYRDAIQQLLPASEGRSMDISTLHRWRAKGVGGIHLEAVRVGGRWCTTQQALQRFFEALSRRAGHHDGILNPCMAPPQSTEASLRKLQAEGF